jgi:hypothetical protein
VTALAVQAALPRSTGDPIVTISIGVAMIFLPVVSPLARAALLALALAFAAPAAGVLTDQPTSTSGAFSALAAIFLATSGCLLLAAVREQTTVAAATADRVIDLGRPVPRSGLDDRRLRGALTGLALLDENRALRATLAAQSGEVRRSRDRLVDAADQERARMQARLAERVEPLLADLELGLHPLVGTYRLQADAQRCCAEIVALRVDLDELSAGLHPRLLAEGGLRAALTDLALRCGVNTTVDAADVRFEPSVERAIWFACAECVANTTKHAAAATRIEVTVWDAADVAAFTVADNGRGGAHVVPGGGLGGLRDRLRALGGGLELTSGSGGTTVTGWVRCRAV